MDIPREFKDVCGQFHHNIHVDCPTLEAMVEFSLREVGGAKAATVKSFLDELLGGRYDEEEIQQAWFDTPADIYFPKRHELLTVLKLMQSMLQKRLDM